MAGKSHKSLSWAAHMADPHRAICDWNLLKSLSESQRQFPVQQVSRRAALSQIPSDLRFAMLITNRNRSPITRLGTLSPEVSGSWVQDDGGGWGGSGGGV